LQIDGLRAEQQDRLEDYNEYKTQVLWKCLHEWENVTPFLFDEITHPLGNTCPVSGILTNSSGKIIWGRILNIGKDLTGLVLMIVTSKKINSPFLTIPPFFVSTLIITFCENKFVDLKTVKTMNTNSSKFFINMF
jgi:hypothetical protein